MIPQRFAHERSRLACPARLGVVVPLDVDVLQRRVAGECVDEQPDLEVAELLVLDGEIEDVARPEPLDVDLAHDLVANGIRSEWDPLALPCTPPWFKNSDSLVPAVSRLIATNFPKTLK